MYFAAQSAMEESWGVSPQLLADYGERDLIDAVRSGDVLVDGRKDDHEELKKLQQRIDYLQKKLGDSYEDNEEDN
jgi:hypothetical protein